MIELKPQWQAHKGISLSVRQGEGRTYGQKQEELQGAGLAQPDLGEEGL